MSTGISSGRRHGPAAGEAWSGACSCGVLLQCSRAHSRALDLEPAGHLWVAAAACQLCTSLADPCRPSRVSDRTSDHAAHGEQRRRASEAGGGRRGGWSLLEVAGGDLHEHGQAWGDRHAGAPEHPAAHTDEHQQHRSQDGQEHQALGAQAARDEPALLQFSDDEDFVQQSASRQRQSELQPMRRNTDPRS